jgi:adenylate kinase family enzyme
MSDRLLLRPVSVGEHDAKQELVSQISDRLNHSSKRRREKELVAQLICNFLLSEGRLLADISAGPETPLPYVRGPQGTILPVDVDYLPFELYLASFRLNPTEEVFAWVAKALEYKCVTEGERVRLSRWWDNKGDYLLVSCGPKYMVRGATLERYPNGTDGVGFASDACLPEWSPTHLAKKPTSLKAFCPPLETPAEAPEYTPEVQRTLFTAWLLALVAGVRPLPLLVFIGAHGSGKTTAARAIVKLLLGETGEVFSPVLDSQTFLLAMARLPIVAIDNLDDSPPSWLQNLLANAISGGALARRKLYTDSVLLAWACRAGLIITTRNPDFASRPDILERTLPIFVGDLPDEMRVGESELISEILQERNAVLSWLAQNAARALPKMKEAPAGLPSRFQEFAKLLWAWQGDDAEKLLRAWRKAQRLGIVDLDPLAQAIITFLPEEGFRGTPTELVRMLQEQGAELPYLGGGKAIARKVRELAPILREAGISVREEKTRGKTVLHIYRKSVDQP